MSLLYSKLCLNQQALFQKTSMIRKTPHPIATTLHPVLPTTPANK